MLVPLRVNTYNYAVVVRKSEKKILKTINQTIQRLKEEGALAKLDEKWMGDAFTVADKEYTDLFNLREAQNQPKKINVKISKLSGTWKMNTLDGFDMSLEGASGKFKTTPILTEGNRGTCRFPNPIPPGEYTLDFPKMKLKAKVTVPALPKSSLTMDLKLAQNPTIQFQ